MCADLIAAAVSAGEIQPGMEAFDLMYAVGNLCVGVEEGRGYDGRRMVSLLVAGLRR